MCSFRRHLTLKVSMILSDFDSVTPLIGNFQTSFSFIVTTIEQLKVLIYFGLNPNGISNELNGANVCFFFCNNRSNANNYYSSPSRVTLTGISYLNGFLKRMFPEYSLLSAPAMIFVGNFVGGKPCPDSMKCQFPISALSKVTSDYSRESS